MATENIDIRISEDGSRVVRRNIEQIGEASDGAHSRVERLAGLLSMVGKFLAVREVMRWADAWSAATSSIKIATNSVADAIIVQDKLFAAAQRARQEFAGMAELYAAVARQSDNLGQSQDGLIKYTENIAKALAIQHTSMEAARGPLLQLGQAMGSGIIRAQEFNSIMLGLPYVMKVVAENFKGGSISVMQLRQVMLDGKLTSKDFFEAFQRGSATIEKDMAKTQVTFGQAMTIFKNELVKFTGTMDSSTGASSHFASVLKVVADNLGLLLASLTAVAAPRLLLPMIEGMQRWYQSTVAAAAGQQALTVAAQQTVAASTAAAAATASNTAAQRAADLSAAEGAAARTTAELNSARATQATIVVVREAAIATLSKANADMRAAEASLIAAKNAGALSYALAVQRESAAALAVADAQRAAATTELAALGQAQARVSVAITAAQEAQLASTRALAAAQGASAAATAASTVATEASVVAQTAAAGAVARTGFAATAAAGGLALFRGAVALMGGPIGVAIVALTGLVMWLSSVRSEAQSAKAAIEAMQRIKDSKNGGAGVRESDAATAAKELAAAQKDLEAVEDRAKNVSKNAGAQERYNQTLQAARDRVKEWSDAVQVANDNSAKTGGAQGAAARALTQAQNEWEGITGKVKTATTVQKQYTEQLEQSKVKYQAYIDQVNKTMPEGKDREKALRDAAAKQADYERQLKKDADQKAKSLEKHGVDRTRMQKIKVEADEERKVLSASLDEAITVENQKFESRKRIMDERHRAGLMSEAQYQADNLLLVQQHEQTERSIIERTLQEYKESYEKRRQLLKDKYSGQAESDALKKLDAEYKNFVTSANGSLEKLETRAFERQEIAIIRLNGEIEKLTDQNRKYWLDADQTIKKQEALAEAQSKFSSMSETEAAATVARIKVGESHSAQIEKLRLAYTEAEQAADAFRKGLDIETAGQDQLNILGALIAKAGTYGMTLDDAVKKLEEMQERAAAAAVKQVENENRFANAKAWGDAISTALLEGGKAGGKKLKDWLKNYFLRNPLTIILNGFLNSLTGMFGGAISSVMGTSNAIDGTSKALGLANSASTANSIYGVGSGYTGTVNTLAGWAGAGQSAGVMSGTLGYANAVGTVGGDSLGALIASNGSWQGLSATGGAGSVAESVALANGSTTASANAGWLSGASGAAIGIAGGMIAGALISGKYSAIGNNSMTATAAGTAIGAAIGSIVGPIGTGVGALVGGIVGGLVNRAFGYKPKEVTDYGIEATLSGEGGASGNSYQSWKQKGGWFRSDKYGTDVKGLDAGTLGGLAQAAQVMGSSALGYAEALGLSADRVLGFSKIIRIALTNDEAKNKEAITAAVTGWYNDLLTALDAEGQVSAMKREGESLSDTFNRVITTLNSVNKIFEVMGISTLSASIGGARAAQALTEVFGSLDGFQSKMSKYYEDFYSEEQKVALTTQQLQKTFAALGLQMPTTREGYRALVEAQDKMTDAGLGTFAVLIENAAAFATITENAGEASKAIEEAAKKLEEIAKQRTELMIRLYEAEGNTAAATALRRQEEMKTIDISNQYLLQMIWAREDEAAAIEAAKKKLEENYNTQLELANKLGEATKKAFDSRNAAGSLVDQIEKAMGGAGDRYSIKRESEMWAELTTATWEQQIVLAGELSQLVIQRAQTETQNAEKLLDFAKSLQTYVQSLTLSDNSTLTLGEKLAQAGSNYSDTLAKARTGDTTAQGALQGMADQYLSLARNYYASGDQYTAIFGNVVAQLQQLGVSATDEANTMLTAAQQSNTLLTTLRDITERNYAIANAAYKDNLTQFQQQYLVLSDIAAKVGKLADVAALLSGLPTSMAVAMNSTAGIAATNLSAGSAMSVESWYRDIEARSAGMLTANDIAASSNTMSQVDVSAIVAGLYNVQLAVKDLQNSNEQDAAATTGAILQGLGSNAETVSQGYADANSRSSWETQQTSSANSYK